MFYVIFIILHEMVLTKGQNRLISLNNDPFTSDQLRTCKFYTAPVDLIFLVDGSTQIKFENYLKIKLFMGNVVNGFDISNDGLKVGVVQYAEYPKLEFSLNSLKNKEETLTMMEMLAPLPQKFRFAGKGIRYISNDELQASKGSRKEAKKIVVVFTDGYSQDDVKQPLQEGISFGIEYFFVTPAERFTFNNVFGVSLELKERVLNLDEFETMKTLIHDRLVRKHCDQEKGKTLDHSKNFQYNISCEKTRISVTVKTVDPFKGKIFIRGYADSHYCRQLQDSFALNYTSMLLMLPTNDCGIRTGYQMFPPGIYLDATLIVSFHPVFLTKMDQSVNIRCFFSDNSTQLNSLTFKKEDVKAKAFYPFTPSCSYTIRLNSEQGPIASVVSIGQKIFHVWECSNGSGQYSVHVHGCSVDDGREIKTILLDETGCSDDVSVWPSVTYNNNYTKVWQQTEAFKFPGGTLVYFTCHLSFCSIDDNYCQESYAPFVNCQSNKSTRSTNQIYADHSVDVYTKISVIEVLENQNFLTEHEPTIGYSLCFNTFHIILILTLSFSTWISIVCYFALRINLRSQSYDLERTG